MPAWATIEVRLLGRFRVVVGGRPVPDVSWRQRKAAALVKLLALEPTHRLHREQVLEALWPELDPEAAANNLRVTLHQARRILAAGTDGAAGGLGREGDLLGFGPPDLLTVDVDAFEAAAARAWRVPDLVAAQAAIDRYAGDLLPEDPYDDWAADRRVVLRASFLTLLDRLARLHEERGELGQAIAVLQRLVAAEPAQEEAHAGLIRLLALTGQRRRALAQYDRLVEVLERDVGAAPEPGTRRLAEAIRVGTFAEAVRPIEPPRAASAEPAPAVAAARPANLPAPPDALIGRERELAELRQLLAGTRLLTLTGPGGIGKTRLALALAHEVVGSFPDGAAFVDLAPVQDPELVVPTIAQALGVRDEGGRSPTDAVAASLRGKRFLLVLDNFEQILPAAPVAAGLLAACPDLTVVVTSRARLRLRGEQGYQVGPLVLPDHPEGTRRRPGAEALAQYAAVALFVQRAREADPTFAVTNETAPAVAEICHRLDGLPLALELAAARVRVLSPPELLARLDRPLTLLTGGPRDLPTRQQTLRGAIAWSHGLLTADEQALFRRLAVFAGDFFLEAAENVSGEVRVESRENVAPSLDSRLSTLDSLGALVEHSLLRQETQADGGSRFRLLETIREFGLERLDAAGEAEETRRRHAAFVLALVERAGPELAGPDQAQWLEHLEGEHDNLRAALGWALEREPATALRLAAGAFVFWQVRGHRTEGRGWLRRVLERGGTGDSLPQRRALYAAATLAAEQGDYAEAGPLLAECLDLTRAAGDTGGTGKVLMAQGFVALAQGAFDRATTLLEEALDLVRATGDAPGERYVLACLGEVARLIGELTRADALYEESLALARRAGHDRYVAINLFNLGLVALDQRRPEAAAGRFAESLRLAAGLKDAALVANGLVGLAAVAAQRGETGRAARLIGAAEGQCAHFDLRLEATERSLLDRAADAARADLGDEAFASARAAGRAVVPEEAVTEALAAAGEPDEPAGRDAVPRR